jgi:hypothetical protein
MTGFGAEATPDKPSYRRMYRCKVHAEGGRYVPGHAIREMRRLDDFVLDVVGMYLGRQAVKDAVLGEAAAIKATAPERTQDTRELVARREELSRLFADGIIERSQLVEGTARIREKLAEIERRAFSQGASGELVRVLLASDSRAAFLASDTATHRSIIKATVAIRIRKGARPGRGFQPELVEFNWIWAN